MPLKTQVETYPNSPLRQLNFNSLVWTDCGTLGGGVQTFFFSYLGILLHVILTLEDLIKQVPGVRNKGFDNPP